MTRSRACAPGSGGWLVNSASRMRRACATGSPRLEDVTRELSHLERLRGLEVCIVAPALDEGRRRGFFVAKGQVVCTRPFVDARGLEWQAGLAAVARAEPTFAPEAADALLLVGSFLLRPPPELELIPLRPNGDLRGIR